MGQDKQFGFTMVELMVTIVVLSVLMALAMPSMSTWIRNSRVRAVSDSLQNGLRLAQAEALRRSRQTVFSLTDSADPKTSLSATANGHNWSINTVQLMTDETAAFVEGGVLGNAGADVQITGPVAVCFNALGRLVVNGSPGVTGADCTAANIPARYVVDVSGADRKLEVRVAIGGQVRMCDPARSLAAYPDGCQ
jgi:type IV fimbrial biogenesis protein FimT